MRFRITLLLLPLIMASISPLAYSFFPIDSQQTQGEENPSNADLEGNYPVDWQAFSIDGNNIFNALGIQEESFISEGRATLAISRLGIHGVNGTILTSDLPLESLIPRTDLSLLIIDGDYQLTEARADLAGINGLVVREYISPSGLIVQGTPNALLLAASTEGVVADLDVPIAMMASDAILEAWLDSYYSPSSAYGALLEGEVRIEGWRDDSTSTVPDAWTLVDDEEVILAGHTGRAAQEFLLQPNRYDAGRWEGKLSLAPQPISDLNSPPAPSPSNLSSTTLSTTLVELLSLPAVGWFHHTPIIGVNNEKARTHMSVNTVESYFTSDLDGSGQVVAVADTGIDHDHGDFGNRIDDKVDLVGDGSTADTDSGHGTHVACSVLGDGTRGGYAGVAPEAHLYFQAMEHDPSGNLYSASINYLLNTAYDNNARTHTNSWGSRQESENGEYTSDSEDVDDRTNYYDRYYNGRDGLTVLFAAGNNGPSSGTVSPPATSKNAVVIGMHQSRYNGAPDTVMSGSSRGPTDDGRIKPDLLAPGGYIRSCLAQEAQDTSGSTWSNQWYMEYTGTSMATPNAAGAAALVREYLTEIALRPNPQGALVKALLVLGAEDMGTRDIPNDNEGWGRINLRNSIAPSGNRGIWVDDRAVLSSSGAMKTYTFEVEQSNLAFKAVLAWSDERGSRFSSSQLVNDLDLEVEMPDGTIYKGNAFANGKSVTAGSRDSTNNLEVVLVDQADVGTWIVRVKDTSHAGSKSQPFALAVAGNGVNDLRPDPAPVEGSLITDIAIPQVGDDVIIATQIQNFGNVIVENLGVDLIIEGIVKETKTISLSPGGLTNLYWNWIPQTDGNISIGVEVDPLGNIDEIRENNNLLVSYIQVTTPGVKVDSSQQSIILSDPDQSTTSWTIALTNTALLATNASLEIGTVYGLSDGQEYPSWYVGASGYNFTLNGSEFTEIQVNMVHPTTPNPETFVIPLTGIDVDNGISYPYSLELVVPSIPDIILNTPAKVLVSPTEATDFYIDLTNQGNDAIGYDIFLDSPSGWNSGLIDLGSQPGAPSGSTGALAKGSVRSIGFTMTPPQVMIEAGTQLSLSLRIVSQTDSAVTWIEEIPIEVEVHEELIISLESTLGILRPDSRVNMQFSVTNNGNSDVTIQPSSILPGGWELVSSMNALQVTWSDSVNWLITIEGNGHAVSGEMKLHLTTATGRETWVGNLSVLTLADPTLTFYSITYPDGTSFSNVLSGGAHPIGQEITLQWQVMNNGDGAWKPYSSLVMPNGFSGDCQQLSEVGPGEEGFVSCFLYIPNTEDPGTQPQIELRMVDGEIIRSDTISLLVAEELAVDWSAELIPNVETGTEHLVKLRLTNSGNAQVSKVIKVNSPNGWDIRIDGEPNVNLEAGQSTSVRLFVKASRAGDGEFIVSLSDAEEVTDSSIEFTLNAEGEDVIEGKSSIIYTAIWSSFILIILTTIIFATIMYKNKTDQNKKAGLQDNHFNPSNQMAARPGVAMPLNPTMGVTGTISQPKVLPPVVPSSNPISSTSAESTSSVAVSPVSSPQSDSFSPAISSNNSDPIPASAMSVAANAENPSESERSNPNHKCWVCLQGLPETGWQGCPNCGARYHLSSGLCGVEKLQSCRNCQGELASFVER